MLFIFFCYSTLGITITNGITDPDIKLYGPNDEEIEKGGSVFIEDLVQLEYEGKYCKYRERTLPFSSDRTITDEDVKSCINPKQIYCIDLVADNEQVKLTDSYNGKSHTVESGGTHMKVHREFVHDSEFMVTIVFNKCPEIELIEKSVLQKLPDDQKCIMITKKLIEQMCYDDVEFPTIEPGSGPETGGDNKPGSSDDGSDGDDSQGDDDKSSNGDNSQGDDDKLSSDDDSSGGDDKPSSDVNKNNEDNGPNIVLIVGIVVAVVVVVVIIIVVIAFAIKKKRVANLEGSASP